MEPFESRSVDAVSWTWVQAPPGVLSNLPGSLPSWGRTRRTDAPPAGPPPGPQSQETAAAGSRGSSGPARP